MHTNPESSDDEITKDNTPQEAPREDGKTGETETYVGSHADNYDPENTPDPDGPRDKPSGENTKNNGEHGGGLWTSGGQVTTGSGYNEPGP